MMVNKFGRAAVLVAMALSVNTTHAKPRAFTHYPAFVKPHAIVETATDRGLIVEIIVRCSRGTGIVRYSKAERVYCGPDHRCHRDLKRAVRRLCQNS